MNIDSHHDRTASERGFRVAMPRESDRLRSPLRCAFEQGASISEDFADLLAAIDDADRRR
jgi:hypothetical protein